MSTIVNGDQRIGNFAVRSMYVRVTRLSVTGAKQNQNQLSQWNKYNILTETKQYKGNSK